MAGRRATAAGGRLFYGWVIVIAFFVLNMAGQASGTLNFGLFVLPMSAELELSRQAIGWAQTARLWAGGLTALIIGRTLDVHGPRLPMLAAIGVTVIGLLWLARAEGAVALFVVMIGLGATGWTAPGGTAIIATVPVAKWFVRLRGRAIALVQLGLGVGGAVLLPLTGWLIATDGWRGAWVVLAWISLATLPLVLLLRREPADLGLQPDGGQADTADGAAATAGAVPGASGATGDAPASAGAAAIDRGAVAEPFQWRLRDALRTPTMWTLAIAFALVGLVLGAASVHRAAHWIEAGYGPTTVSVAFGLDAAMATLVTLIAGFTSDRLGGRLVGVSACSLFAVATGAMALPLRWPPLLFVATLLFGAGIGMNMIAQGVLWAEYYGRRFVGTIRGVVFPAGLLAGGIAAPLTGALRDATGSYQVAWIGAGLLCAAAAVLVLVSRPPQPPQPHRRGDSQLDVNSKAGDSLT